MNKWKWIGAACAVAVVGFLSNGVKNYYIEQSEQQLRKERMERDEEAQRLATFKRNPKANVSVSLNQKRHTITGVYIPEADITIENRNPVPLKSFTLQCDKDVGSSQDGRTSTWTQELDGTYYNMFVKSSAVPANSKKTFAEIRLNSPSLEARRVRCEVDTVTLDQ